MDRCRGAKYKKREQALWLLGAVLLCAGWMGCSDDDSCNHNSVNTNSNSNFNFNSNDLDATVSEDASTPADATVTQDGAVEPESLRIMTYNIRHGAESDLEAIADVIRLEEPDLVGLQEVDVDADRSGNVDQASRLSQLTGMASVFRSALTFGSGGYYGLALLSRFPILSASKVELTSPGEQRILLTAEILTDHTTLNIAVTHLGLGAERIDQASEIVAVLTGLEYVILMGDMNAVPSAPEMQTLVAAFADVWLQGGVGDGYTIPVNVPTRRIDYILLGPEWPSATEAHVPSTTASDHLPVVATVPWP
jgi:endonuclease/exonuclease/phosphatase family metal-dependent hydrolase